MKLLVEKLIGHLMLKPDPTMRQLHTCLLDSQREENVTLRAT